MAEQDFISKREYKYSDENTYTIIDYDINWNILIKWYSKNDNDNIIININSEELRNIVDVLKNEKPYIFKEADRALKVCKNIESKDLELCVIAFKQLFWKECGYKSLLEFIKKYNINAQVKSN